MAFIIVGGQIIKVGNKFPTFVNDSTPVPVPWTPASITGILSWHDASGLVVNTDNSYGTVDVSNKVSSFKDLSGNDKHYEQGNGTNQPTLQTSKINGYPSIYYTWNTGAQYMTQILNGGVGSLFIIWRCDFPTFYNITGVPVYLFDGTIWGDGASGGDVGIWGDDSSISDRGINVGFSQFRTDGTFYTNGTVTPLVVSWVYPPVIFTDFNLSYFSEVVPTETVTTRIGHRENGQLANPSLQWRGHIHEVIHYDHQLSDVDRILVETYLNDKYLIW